MEDIISEGNKKNKWLEIQRQEQSKKVQGLE